MSEPQLRLEKAAEEENSATLQEPAGAEPIPPSDIVSFNELRSCADLFRLYDTGKLEIQPDFQRDVVWKPNEQSRFIDSLVKQLPIPSMCFSLDYKTQRWKVIDGLQRMSSIISFLGGAPWRLQVMDDIHPQLRGRRNVDLKNGSPEDQLLYSTVQDVSIPITVLRCDYTQRAHMNYLFTIFHRLNSGGVRLNNQEIRNCIYTGSFNSMLKDFDKSNSDWSKIKKRVWGSTDRFKSVELLLRALAFDSSYEKYDGNLAVFLNGYMHSRMHVDAEEVSLFQNRLEKMSKYALYALDGESRTKISMTFIEATLVGILRNLEAIVTKPPSELKARFVEMLKEPSFANAAKYAIASEGNVKKRMSAATSVFSRQ